MIALGVREGKGAPGRGDGRRELRIQGAGMGFLCLGVTEKEETARNETGEVGTRP